MSSTFIKQFEKKGVLTFLDDKIIINSHNDLYIYNKKDFKVCGTTTLLNENWLSSNFDIIENEYICYIDNCENVVCLIEIDTLKISKELNKGSLESFDLIRVYDRSNVLIFDTQDEYGEIRLLNIDDNSIKIFSTESSERGLNDIACSFEKKLLFSTHNNDINVWSVESQKIIHKIKHYSISLAVSYNNKYLASASLENSEDIYIYDTDTWEHVKTVSGMEDENRYLNYHDDISSILFSPDDKYLIAYYYHNSVKIFDFETGNKIYEVRCRNISCYKDNIYEYFNDENGLNLFKLNLHEKQ